MLGCSIWLSRISRLENLLMWMNDLIKADLVCFHDRWNQNFDSLIELKDKRNETKVAKQKTITSNSKRAKTGDKSTIIIRRTLCMRNISNVYFFLPYGLDAKQTPLTSKNPLSMHLPNSLSLSLMEHYSESKIKIGTGHLHDILTIFSVH